MTSHDELVSEMASLERLSVQDRLKLARKRRAQQLKRWSTSDKEFTKKSRKGTVGKMGPGGLKKRRINFAHNIQLLEAAARGDIDEVRLLLESGVDPNIGNEDGLTALHQCCIDNNEAMMKLLVEHNADVNVMDREHWTPLHASSTCGHSNLARFLVSKGAELLAINSDGNMPYDICEDEVTLDYIESQMAERGITQEQIDELRDVAPNRMLNELSEIKNSEHDLEAPDDMGATYLHIAAANGYDKVAKFLLDSNVDVNAKDNDGWQPIHAASCWAHGEMIQLLVQYGADLDAKTNNEETPLTICEDEDLKNLINQLKAEINSHRSLENRLVRRNSSRNKRSSSIRRSSKREKGEMRKLDAKGEAMFIQSQAPGDEIPGLDIAVVDREEIPQSPVSMASVTLDGADEEIEGGAEINGALETDIIPMPVITEETPESPDRKSQLKNGDGSVMRNGGKSQTGGRGVPVMQRQPKSILKKRKEQEVVEDPSAKKSRREKSKEVDSGKQEEERQREREERERAKQREREERQWKKEEKEREKQRIKEEKRLLRKREKEEKEQLKRKTISEETRNVTGENKTDENKTEDNKTEDSEDKPEERDSNHSGHIETLAELKRHRASENAKRTHSGESEEDFEVNYRKDSFDILKDHKSQNSTKKKSPHIVRKILPHRMSGSYNFNEASQGDGHRDSTGSEQNGISDQSGLNTSELSNIPLEPYPGDPPLKRFTAIEPEVIGGEDRRCCIIL